MECNDSDRLASDKTECEIEITPEMIEAGAGFLRASLEGCFPYSSNYPEFAAAEVFRAMVRLHPNPALLRQEHGKTE